MGTTGLPQSPQPFLTRLLSFGEEGCVVAFSKVGENASIVAEIEDARQGLIAGLQSVQHDCGWHDPTEESTKSLWTCLEVCKSLLEAGQPIRNLDAILARIAAAEISVGDLTGWESEGLQGLVSTYQTSDAGLLFLALGRHSELTTVLTTLQKMQNPDGGWGVCSCDSVSKTRATGFVVRLYAACLTSPWAFGLLDPESYVEAILWLNRARNDSDGGWGNFADVPPSNVSATAIALDALVSTELAMHKHPGLKLPVRHSAVHAGLSKIIALGQEGKWRGRVEELGVQAPGEHHIRRHTTSGVGTLLVTQVLAKSARLGYVSPEDPYLSHAIRDLCERCQSYLSKDGQWIVPSDQRGPPTSWNSAFALDAFAEFERLYVDYSRRGVIETRILRGALLKKTLWKRVSILLAALLGVIVLVPRLGFLSGAVT